MLTKERKYMKPCEVKIEKGVELQQKGYSGFWREIFDKMGKGDSFIKPENLSDWGIRYAAKRSGVVIVMRKRSEGMRVWLIDRSQNG